MQTLVYRKGECETENREAGKDLNWQNDLQVLRLNIRGQKLMRQSLVPSYFRWHFDLFLSWQLSSQPLDTGLDCLQPRSCKSASSNHYSAAPLPHLLRTEVDLKGSVSVPWPLCVFLSQTCSKCLGNFHFPKLLTRTVWQSTLWRGSFSQMSTKA